MTFEEHRGNLAFMLCKGVAFSRVSLSYRCGRMIVHCIWATNLKCVQASPLSKCSLRALNVIAEALHLVYKRQTLRAVLAPSFFVTAR